MATVALPAGFVEQHTGDTLWWVKAEWAPVLRDAVVRSSRGLTSSDAGRRLPPPSGGTPDNTTSLSGGRGSVQRIEAGSQGAIIVRPYRRGGFVRHFVYDLYWDRPLRPFAELCCIEEVRRHGVPTVEVLGAQVEWTIGPLYRGLLVTREATGFHELWTWLQTRPSTELRRATLSTVAQVIAIMHQAGIAHADLNPTNILVCPDRDPPQALIIDFDRARLFSKPVSLRLREANLRRFRRFFTNYDVLDKSLPLADFEHFLQMYRTALSR